MKEERNENAAQHFYTEKEIEKLSEYIRQQYGEYEDVLHEIVSPDIHCDIVVVPPSEKQPYFKLVTVGAGAYKMQIPKELKSDVCDRAEYVIFLPKDWNLESDNEEDFWPIRMLKTIARLTVNTDGWLCYSHTIQLTQDGRPVAENTGFNSCALLFSTGKNGQMVKPRKLGFFGKKVAFYQLYPLYPEELKFKLEHSINELIDRLETEENLIINIHRNNYCK
ncbi:MAG: suppressor of fused domain protein [Prevotella sp.]|nr:suppressor of fused domain protein [Prevotella sp.]